MSHVITILSPPQMPFCMLLMLLGPHEVPVFPYGQNALTTSPKMCEPHAHPLSTSFLPHLWSPLDDLRLSPCMFAAGLIQAPLPANMWACTTALLTLCPLCIGATHSAVEDQAPPVSRHFVFYSQQCPVKQWQSHH